MTNRDQTAPRAPRIPSVRDLARRPRHRRLRLDARPCAAGVPRVPGRRARLLRRADGAPGRADRRLFAEAVARTPTRADDSVSWPLRGLPVPAPDTSGQARIASCFGQAPASRCSRRAGPAAGREHARRGEPATWTSGAPSPARTAGCWPGRPTPPARRSTGCGSGTSTPARTCPTSSSAATRAWPGQRGAHLFYLVPDELNRPCQVWRHRSARPASDDVLVYGEADARFELELHALPQRRAGPDHGRRRGTPPRSRLIPPAGRCRDPVLVEPRRRGIEYRVDHAADPPGRRRAVHRHRRRRGRVPLMRAPVERRAGRTGRRWTARPSPRPGPTPGCWAAT